MLTMKRSSTSKIVASDVKGLSGIDWELRPGGMLVQKRQPLECSSSSPMIKIKVSHGSYHHEVTVPTQSTFGHLKMLLTSKTGLEPKEQRLLFRGKEKEDEEILDMVGVTDMSKVILLEDPASKERKIEMQRSDDVFKACEAVSSVRKEVDKLYEKVVDLETSVRCGTKVEDNEFVTITELLMVQLLNLDSIAADGEAKVQRRIEVRRVQSYLDIIENLKATKSTTSLINKWEPFESAIGSFQSSTVITQEWEHFE